MTDLDQRIQTIEAENQDLKEKLGYDLVPADSNVQAEIDALEPEYVKNLFENMLDEAIDEETPKTVTFILLYDGSYVGGATITLRNISNSDEYISSVSDSNGECSIVNIPNGEYILNIAGDGVWYAPIDEERIIVDANHTNFELNIYITQEL